MVLRSTNPGLSIPYCIPYAYNTMQQDPLVTVNAGADGSTTVCDNSVVATNLSAVITGEQSGGTWSRLSGTGGTFVAASGQFTPAVGATTSVFQYTLTGTLSCPGDQSTATVTIVPGPTASFVPIPAKCVNLVEQNDGRIVLTAYSSSVDRVGVSSGVVYAGPAYAAATAVTGVNQNVQTNIPNVGGGTFTVRIFGGGDACYRDYVIVVPPGIPCKTDPMGYIYCEETGKIITGGSITVTPPAGGTYVITQNGSNGTFQFFTDGTAGIYTITYTPPLGYSLSMNHLSGGTLDPTGQPNPYTLGSGSANGTTLDNYTPGANPFYMSFDFASGDPEIFNNNIPLKGCCVPSTLTATDGSVCTGGSIDLASLVTGSSGGTLSYYTSLANAQSGTNALPSSVVTPTAATNYYIRSETSNNCYNVEEVTVTIKAANCGSITVSGPGN